MHGNSHISIYLYSFSCAVPRTKIGSSHKHILWVAEFDYSFLTNSKFSFLSPSGY